MNWLITRRMLSLPHTQETELRAGRLLGMIAHFGQNQSVHLCLDMQRLFAPGGVWSTPWMTKVTPAVVRIAEAFSARNAFTRFIPPISVDDAVGMWRPFYNKWQEVTRARLDAGQLRLIEPLEKLVPPGTIIDKSGYSAFYNSPLHAWLQTRRVNTLIISGAETDICVLSTVLAAIDYGYRVILVEDALCSSSDDGHDALMRMYRNRLSIQLEIGTSDEVLDALVQ